MNAQTQERAELITVARRLHRDGLTHGSTGNVSVRCSEGLLVTPTGSRLSTVEADELSTISLGGRHLDGPRPSKEAFLHAAVLLARPSANAVVHTHSTYSAAVSCLDDLDPDDCLPALTAYFAMRVGALALLPFHAPGDPELARCVEAASERGPALLLSHHGPVAAGVNADAAADVLEEVEQTARIFLLLRGLPATPLDPGQRARLAGYPHSGPGASGHRTPASTPADTEGSDQ